MREHLGGGGEGIGAATAGVVARRGRGRQLARGQHEAAADRIVGLAAGAGCRRRRRPRAPGRWRGRAAAGRSRRRGRCAGSKASSGRPGGVDAAGRGDARPAPRAARGGVEVVGVEAGEAEDHRPVGGVALAGEGEAAVQPAAEPGRRRRSRGCGRRRRAARRGSGAAATIGPMVCERRGADADLEDVEDAEEHGAHLEASRRRLVRRNATAAPRRRAANRLSAAGNAPITRPHRTGGPARCRSLPPTKPSAPPRRARSRWSRTA